MDILFYGTIFLAYYKTMDTLGKMFGPKNKRGPYKKKLY